MLSLSIPYINVHGENNREEISTQLSTLFPLADIIIKLAKENDLRYILTGHLSLIAFFQKAYRQPSDIDILVDVAQIDKWIQLLNKEWLCFMDIANIKSILEKKMFASIGDKNNPSNNSSPIFAVNGNNISYNENQNPIIQANYNYSDFDKKVNLLKNPWIKHNPNEQSPFGFNQFGNINDEYFCVSFKSPQIINHGKNHSAYITLFDENKSIIETIELNEELELNSGDELESESWWLSDFIKRPQSIFSYQIYIQKNDLIISFLNKNNGIKLELIVGGNFFNLNYVEKNIHGNMINIASPEHVFKTKYGRKKDINDINFFKS